MKYNKKFIHYSFLLASLFSVVILLLFTSLCMSEEENELYSGFLGIDSTGKLLIGLGIVFVLYEVITLIICLLDWKMISYEITDEGISLQKGIIFKKKVVVPYEKMHAVTVERNLFIRFFRLSTLNIDSGNAGKSHVDEIVIIESKEFIEKLEKEIKHRIALVKKGVDLNESVSEKVDEVLEDSAYKEVKDVYNKKLRKELVYGSIAFRIYGFIFFAVDLFVILAILFTEGFSLATIFIGITIFFIVLFGVSELCNLSYFIKYYNYKLEYNDEELIVSYGLFTQHRHNISRSKIKGIIIKQDVVQMKRGYASLLVEMVGLYKMTNEDSEELNNYLIPLENVSKLKEDLKELNLNYEYQEVPNNVSKKSFVHFFSIPAIIIGGIALPFIIGFINSIIAVIILGIVLIVIGVIMLFTSISKKHQGVIFDQNNLYFTTGCLIKSTFIIPWLSIVSIGIDTTPWRLKKGIVSMVIEYYATKGQTKKKVLMIEKATYEACLAHFEVVKNN